MSSAPGHLSQMQVLVVKFPEVATVRKVVNIIKIIIIMITIIIIIRAPFYEYLKKDLWSHLGIELGTFRTEGRELTICANSPS